MATNGLRKALDHLQQVLTPDEQLLQRFISQRDEGAFAALVKRHGPMVWGVCRRILGHAHDSEDAFQATFFLLARKAPSIVNRKAIAGWLYTVAFRTASEARMVNARRGKREKQVPAMPHPEAAPFEPADWRQVLDEELNRLPEKFRIPVILCDLEGRTRKEAAGQLGLPEGTLSSRLATARRKLAQKLGRRGVVFSGGALATVMSEAAASVFVSPALMMMTIKGAVQVAANSLALVSTPVALLMKGAMKAMFMAKIKSTVATVGVLALLAGGSLVYCAGGGSDPGQTPAPKNELEMLRRENELLKVNLRITLEKIQTLERELSRLKGPPSHRPMELTLQCIKCHAAKSTGCIRDNLHNGKGISTGFAPLVGPDIFVDLDKDGAIDLFIQNQQLIHEIEKVIPLLRQNPADVDNHKKAVQTLENLAKKLRKLDGKKTK